MVLEPKTPLEMSEKKRVRDFEDDAYQEALRIVHNNGEHEEWERRDCSACSYNGNRPEMRVKNNE